MPGVVGGHGAGVGRSGAGRVVPEEVGELAAAAGDARPDGARRAGRGCGRSRRSRGRTGRAARRRPGSRGGAARGRRRRRAVPSRSMASSSGRRWRRTRAGPPSSRVVGAGVAAATTARYSVPSRPGQRPALRRRSSSRQAFVATRYDHVLNAARPSKRRMPRAMAMSASCSASSASWSLPTTRRHRRHSRSWCRRSRASSAARSPAWAAATSVRSSAAGVMAASVGQRGRAARQPKTRTSSTCT